MNGFTRYLGFGILFLSTSVNAYTLHDAVEAALQEHPTILAAKANELGSEYSVRRAFGGYLPQVTMHAARGRQNSNNSFVQTSLNRHNIVLNRTENEVSISQLLFDGWRTNNIVKTERFNLASSNERLLASQQAVMRDVAESYLNVLRSRELLILARNNIRVHNETRELVSLRYRGGAGTIGEVQLADSRLDLSRLRLHEAEGIAARFEARYLAALGSLPPDHLRAPLSLQTHLPKTAEQAVQIALGHNPDLNRLRADEQAAWAQIGVAKAAFSPTLTFEAHATHNNNLDGLPGRNSDMAGALTLNYPVFSGGSDWANLNQSRAKRLEAQHKIEETRRRVVAAVMSAWTDYQTDIQRTRSQHAYVDNAKKVVVDFKEQFTLGKRALFNVLDAENELYQARVGLTEAYYDHLVDSFRIMESTGTLSETMV